MPKKLTHNLDAYFDMSPLLLELLKRAILEEYDLELPYDSLEVTLPKDARWGDYTTSIAMRLARSLKQPPMQIAKNLSYRLAELLSDQEIGGDSFVVDVVNPGFINITLPKSRLISLLNSLSTLPLDYKTYNSLVFLRPDLLRGQKVIVEYTDPNPFKLFHIGHLMPNAVGESLSRLFEFSGATVRRANYQGDVGMHVAKSVWGMRRLFMQDKTSLEALASLPLPARIAFLGRAYAFGARAFKEDPAAREQITSLNGQIFVIAQQMLVSERNWIPRVDYAQLLNVSEIDPEIRNLYLTGRSWSLAYFEQLYQLLGTHFDSYYFESMTGEYGYDLVMRALNDKHSQSVFEKDNNAIIFRGEPHGLHTRVFINSKGLPTYEAKDLGLIYLKYEDFQYDASYIVTASEQAPYFKVVLKVLSLLNPDLAERTHHIAHGMLVLTTGKMSSRTGDVISVEELLQQLSDLANERLVNSSSTFDVIATRSIADAIAVSAVKFAILKQQLGKNITYDKKQSLKLTGDTGPYLQYTFVRALSILNKLPSTTLPPLPSDILDTLSELPSDGLSLLHKLLYFRRVVARTTSLRAPSYLCAYLLDLAGTFNRFYANTKILTEQDSHLQNFYLHLVYGVALDIKVGLDLLGIRVVDRM